jgi:hypothetical protein
VSAARCPRCGGLIRPEAEWCGQCLAPLGRAREKRPTAPDQRTPIPSGEAVRATPEAAPPAGEPRRQARIAPISGTRVRKGEHGIVWDCPTCGTENPIEIATCSGCGAPFSRLFEQPAPAPKVDPGRARSLSLLFPGLGHVAAGRAAEGLARAVVFAYALITSIVILASRWGSGLGPFLPLFVICFLAAVALYVLAAVDAGRAVRRERPLLSMRALLYGAAGLIVITVVIVVILGIRAGGTPG